MNTPKAIKILTDYQAGVEMEELREYPDVISIAIEALKRIQHDRQHPAYITTELLPGETED